jgi:hypothetical protein
MTQGVLNCTLTYARKWGVELDNEQWYEHVPKLLETDNEGKVTILWNKPVQTDRTVRKNKPDIIICDNEKCICMTIDVAISVDRDVIKKSNTSKNTGQLETF